MKKPFVLLCVMMATLLLVADIPTVPNSIQFAGLNLKLTDKARRKIQVEVDALTRSPKYFQVKVDRLQIYFPIIEEIFREEGLPEDFKYLVLQESALISDAVSSSNAVGFWQFKKASATEVGLRVDRQVDERLNIVASTRGAAKYIKKNNRLFFDNWVHALLAYQQGPGGAQKLVSNKYKGTRNMPIDGRTHWYVIKFLAHKIAFEQVKSAEPGLYLLPYYEGQGKSLKEIARDQRLDTDLVVMYNKWLKHGKVPTDRKYAVILPYVKRPQMLASTAVRNQERTQSTGSGETKVTLSSDYRTHPTKYPVITSYGLFRNKGIKINGIKGIRLTEDMDLEALSNLTGVSVNRLLNYNDVVSNKKAREGELWYIKRKKSKAKESYHIAEMGEDLWTISQKYGIRLVQLRKKNHIPKKQLTVKPGRVLWLNETRPKDLPIAYVEIVTSELAPENSSTEQVRSQQKRPDRMEKTVNNQVVVEDSPAENKPAERPVVSDEIATERQTNVNENATKPDKKVHVVIQGETLYGIARKYGTTTEELQQYNRLDSNASLKIGQQLLIPTAKQSNTASTPIDEPEAEFEWYEVRQGDTLYQIARKHGTNINQLMKLNDKADFNLSIGDRLKVPLKR